MDAHITPAASCLPLDREVRLTATNGPRCPWHVCRRTHPPRRHATRRLHIIASLASAQHLAAVSHAVFAALAKRGLRRIGQHPQPALSVRVIPARVEPEAHGVAAERPAVAALWVRLALVTTLLLRVTSIELLKPVG